MHFMSHSGRHKMTEGWHWYIAELHFDKQFSWATHSKKHCILFKTSKWFGSFQSRCIFLNTNLHRCHLSQSNTPLLPHVPMSTQSTPAGTAPASSVSLSAASLLNLPHTCCLFAHYVFSTYTSQFASVAFQILVFYLFLIPLVCMYCLIWILTCACLPVFT